MMGDKIKIKPNMMERGIVPQRKGFQKKGTRG